MEAVKIKGHEIRAAPVRDSFNRRSVQFMNNIIKSLGKIGLSEDDVEVEMEPNAIKKLAASASWWIEGYHLHYSYSSQDRFVDNLNIVSKVIDAEVNAVLSEQKTINDFISDFAEDKDIKEQRKKARETLGLGEEINDLKLIDKAYKELAKESHPDMPNGDTEKFKSINRAHKILKRELQ
ncbi:MAG TPA: DnaJ domain-containing protein [Candidatus Nanoarchaeia archaeon]|nr:DnaJ domain-containing protein [Candidatus Nanoarchaeia archaeon]